MFLAALSAGALIQPPSLSGAALSSFVRRPARHGRNRAPCHRRHGHMGT